MIKFIKNYLQNKDIFSIFCELFIYYWVVVVFQFIIVDPIIGYASPRIEYGKQDILSKKYLKKYLTEEGHIIQNYRGITKVWWPEDSRSNPYIICKHKKITINYTYDHLSGYKFYLMSLLPSTLFGEQRVFISCDQEVSYPKEIEKLVLSEPDWTDCIDIQIQYYNDKYPYYFYGCAAKRYGY